MACVACCSPLCPSPWLYDLSPFYPPGHQQEGQNRVAVFWQTCFPVINNLAGHFSWTTILFLTLRSILSAVILALLFVQGKYSCLDYLWRCQISANLSSHALSLKKGHLNEPFYIWDPAALVFTEQWNDLSLHQSNIASNIAWMGKLEQITCTLHW